MLAGAVLLVLGACSAPSVQGPPPAAGAVERLRFAVVGDAPYSAGEVPRFSALLASLAAEAPAFILHVGDIKGGSEPCSDARLAERVVQLREPPVPLVLTPGDNEWTDCHREAAGAYHPLERLARLRQLAYAEPSLTLGGQPMRVQTQASDGGLPEHQAFELQGVRVVTLHVVGSQNGLVPWEPIAERHRHGRGTHASDRAAEVAAREAAAIRWLRAQVALAQAPQVRALVVVFQANPGLEHPAGHPERRGFERLLGELQAQLTSLRKPVLLVHGDHHRYFVDRPWPALPSVMRVQTWGSPWVGGVRVRVLEEAPDAPWRFVLESVIGGP